MCECMHACIHVRLYIYTSTCHACVYMHTSIMWVSVHAYVHTWLCEYMTCHIKVWQRTNASGHSVVIKNIQIKILPQLHQDARKIHKWEQRRTWRQVWKCRNLQPDEIQAPQYKKLKQLRVWPAKGKHYLGMDNIYFSMTDWLLPEIAFHW